MKRDVEMNDVGEQLIQSIGVEEIAENVERFLGAVGRMVERSVDVSLRLAEQVSEDGTQVAAEGMALGNALKRELFGVARSVSKDLSEALGSTNDE